MEKHERAYVCEVEECQNSQGFTHSGDLLRHEREVHGKHRGLEKMIFCPHMTCKRSNGKAFSYRGNLTTHLRRILTFADSVQMDVPGHNNTVDRSDVASAAPTAIISGGMSPTNLDYLSPCTVKNKRKRSYDEAVGNDDHPDGDIRTENERLRKEAADLRQQLNSTLLWHG